MGDICFSEELIETLQALGRGETLHSPDATGYLLRGFFDGLRRHIVLERQLVAVLLAP